MIGTVPNSLKVISASCLVRGRLTKFLVAGGISYLVNQVVLFLVYELVGSHSTGTSLGSFDVALLMASLIALELSIVVRFELNDHWTFAGLNRKPHGRRFLQSNLSSLGSPVIALAAVNFLTPVLDLNYLIANSIGIALGTAWNWCWSTRVIWRVPATGSENQH